MDSRYESYSESKSKIKSRFSERYSHSAVVWHDEIIIIGGLHQFKKLNDVWRSVDGFNWEQVYDDDLPKYTEFKNRACHRAEVFNDEIVVIGGLDKENITMSDVWGLNIPDLDQCSNTDLDQFDVIQ